MRLRWTGSLAVVVAAHLGLGAFWLPHARLVPELAAPAVMVDMVPLPTDPVPKPTQSQPEASPPPEPPPSEPARPDPQLPQSSAQPEPPPHDPPPPAPPVPEPPLHEPSSLVPAQLEPPPPAIPAEGGLPVPSKPRLAKPQAPRPRSVPRPVPDQPPAVLPHVTPPEPAPVASRSVAPPDSWQAKLFAHLAGFKRYPAEAQRRRQEGVPTLRLVMDRAGAVLSVSLEKSSGFPLLDAEALALPQRAQPLPALPAEVSAQTIEIIVPLSLR